MTKIFQKEGENGYLIQPDEAVPPVDGDWHEATLEGDYEMEANN